jgi:hypothetical protein
VWEIRAVASSRLLPAHASDLFFGCKSLNFRRICTLNSYQSKGDPERVYAELRRLLDRRELLREKLRVLNLLATVKQKQILEQKLQELQDETPKQLQLQQKTEHVWERGRRDCEVRGAPSSRSKKTFRGQEKPAHVDRTVCCCVVSTYSCSVMRNVVR